MGLYGYSKLVVWSGATSPQKKEIGGGGKCLFLFIKNGKERSDLKRSHRHHPPPSGAVLLM